MKSLFSEEQNVSVYINPRFKDVLADHAVSTLQDVFSISRSQLSSLQSDPEKAIELHSLLELIKEVTPFPLETFSALQRIDSGYSFGLSLASLFYVMQVQQKVISVLKDKRKTLERLGRIVKNQRQQIKGYEKEYEDSQKKGTLLYEEYGAVKQLLDDIQSYSLERIADNLSDVQKHYPFLISVSSKKREILIEIDSQH
jgi:predicted ribosome quality control (RQC) complex YloA/Tae2 family protein